MLVAHLPSLYITSSDFRTPGGSLRDDTDGEYPGSTAVTVCALVSTFTSLNLQIDPNSHPVFLPGYRMVLHRIGQPGRGVGKAGADCLAK